jgi:uncharacterized damage-inducible protein DinB
MTVPDAKADLHRYLRAARESLLWKVDGLSEYDVRRPLVPTGTNLLGLLKHLAGVEAGYFGETFGRPFDGPVTEPTDDDPNVDMWVTEAETRDEIIGGYRRACAHADETIETFEIDAIGRVPWWPAERAEVSLHRILVHMVAETQRHAGHADIVRELIDGAAGLRSGNENLPSADPAYWDAHRRRVETAARAFADETRPPDRP